MLCGDQNEKEIQKRGDRCICIADSLCYTAEINTMLQSNCTPMKINKKNKLEGWDGVGGGGGSRRRDMRIPMADAC